jgi:hypothetical protein
MKFVAIVDTEGTAGPPPDRAIGKRIVIEVEPDSKLEDAIEECCRTWAAELPTDPLHYWIHFLRGSQATDPEYVPYPNAVVAEDAEAA